MTDPKITPTIISKRHFLCPCGDATPHYFEHLGNGRGGGPWYCGSCWVGWFANLDSDGGLTIEDRGHRMRKIAARVRLQPQKLPVDFIVTARAFRDDGVKPGIGDAGNSAYFYEEHSCPSNTMRDVLEVVIGDDNDPHGLLEYVECFEQESGTP